jgi:xanthine/CO dehydrogenase XdhC/CoxF family maturation factor
LKLRWRGGSFCGGQLDVFVEPVLPVPGAFIFGAGHISKSLSKVANLAATWLEELMFAR